VCLGGEQDLSGTPLRRTGSTIETEEKAMRSDEPNRHGRAADALIASYLRELLADEEPRPSGESPHAAPLPPLAATTPEQTAADATL
jgi:hypothetical protein